MNRVILIALVWALGSNESGFANNTEEPEIAGRISHIAGDVSVLRGGQPPAVKLDPRRDLLKLIYRGDSLTLASGAQLELLTGRDRVLVKGPQRNYSVAWSCPEWEERIRQAVVSTRPRTGYVPAGRARGSSGDADEMDLAKAVGILAARAHFDLRVAIMGDRDSAYVTQLCEALPVYVSECADVDQADVVLRRPPTPIDAAGVGIRLERANGTLITEQYPSSIRAYLEDALAGEAVWNGLRTLRNTGTGCRIKLALHLVDATGASLTGEPAAITAGKRAVAVCENRGSEPAYLTLVYANTAGDVSIQEKEFLITPTDPARQIRLPVAVASPPAQREILLLWGSSEPISKNTIPKDWNAIALEFRVLQQPNS